jgi:hypothetical protein
VLPTITIKERGFALKIKYLFTSHRFWLLSVFLICAIGVLLILQSPSVNAGDKTKDKRVADQKAFELYKQKCLGCHDSVADPEKPGRTRDDWHLVVNVMHGYGLELTNDESEMIIDLLYDLRKGLEKEAG